MQQYARPCFVKSSLKAVICQVSKAEIRNRYNQVPRLTQDTTCESDKTQENIIYESQEVSPFPAGGHKTAMNRRESMTNTKHDNKNDPQKKHHLVTVSKNIFTEGLRLVLWYKPHPYFKCGSRSIDNWFA